MRGKTGINTVINTSARETSQTLYGFNGSKPFVTGGHPFYTRDGWKAVDPDLTPSEKHNVKTTKLQVGDVLLLDDGNEVVLASINASTDAAEHTVHNPMLDGDHTYYANGMLVHNKIAACHDGGADCTYNGALNWGAACAANYNGTVADGDSFTAMNTTAGYNGSITYICNNGAWNLGANNCTPVAAAPCNLPWGGSIPDGASVTAYSVASSANCAANSEVRSCTNGTLSGSYANQNCAAPVCAAGVPACESTGPNAAYVASCAASSGIVQNMGACVYDGGCDASYR